LRRPGETGQYPPLTTAIEEVRRKGGEDARQIEQKLRDEPWEDVGRFAAYSCQDDALHPEPWQPVPANEYVSVTDDDGDYGPVSGRAAAAELLRRLMAAWPQPFRARSAQCA
jgi:hypothetical protein